MKCHLRIILGPEVCGSVLSLSQQTIVLPSKELFPAHQFHLPETRSGMISGSEWLSPRKDQVHGIESSLTVN